MFNCDNVRRWRKANEITQETMARELNISRVWLSRLESGREQPSAELAARIQKYMIDNDHDVFHVVWRA